MVDFFKWDRGHTLRPKSSIHYENVGQFTLEDSVVIALRENKWEAGHGDPNVCMEIAWDHDLLVQVLLKSNGVAATIFLIYS